MKFDIVSLPLFFTAIPWSHYHWYDSWRVAIWQAEASNMRLTPIHTRLSSPVYTHFICHLGHHNILLQPVLGCQGSFSPNGRPKTLVTNAGLTPNVFHSLRLKTENQKEVESQ